MYPVRECILQYAPSLAIEMLTVPCSQEPTATAEERLFIREEAQRLFKANKNLTESEEIRQCIREAEARVDIGEA